MSLNFREVPSQARLLELFEYDPVSGWLIRRRVTGGQLSGVRAGSMKRNYIVVAVDGLQYYAHRIVWRIAYGDGPIPEIDHANHDGYDNRLENLRGVSRKQNQENYSLRVDNTSGVTGIDRKKNKWRVRIHQNGKSIHVGEFKCLSDAILARKRAETELWTHAPV